MYKRTVLLALLPLFSCKPRHFNNDADVKDSAVMKGFSERFAKAQMNETLYNQNLLGKTFSCNVIDEGRSSLNAEILLFEKDKAANSLKLKAGTAVFNGFFGTSSANFERGSSQSMAFRWEKDSNTLIGERLSVYEINEALKSQTTGKQDLTHYYVCKLKANK